MPTTKEAKPCKHQGYLMRDGVLVCAECGKPSPSDHWRTNVYGAQAENTPAR